MLDEASVAWQDQGRQEHGWFGHGTAGQKADGAAAQGGLFGRDGLDQRIEAIAYGAIASLPSSLRRRAEAESDAGTRSKLTEVMRAWIGGARLDQASFAERFFGRAPDDQIVAKLRAAAQGADMAESHAELRDAAGQLADAIQTVGLDRWRRFLADAQDRSRDAATIAAVEDSRMPSDTSKDAIRPVYPLETAIGIVAAGIAGGAVAGVRAAGGAILRQIAPERAPPVIRGEKSTSTQTIISEADKPSTPEASPIPLSRTRFGHTFEKHGQNATEFLTRRAQSTGRPNGQFLDNQAAARFIHENLDKASNGPVSVPIPKGFPARVINPDGSFSPARSIRLVPGAKRVKTAYPEP